jgi:tape measure domain-containing protein
MADDQKIGLQAVWDNTDFHKGQREYVERIAKASGATVSAANTMSGGGGGGRGLSGAVVAVGTALGHLAAGAILNFISGVSEMSSAVVTNLGDLQKLEIGLTMLEAREMTMAGLTDTVAEAMDGASLRASSMLEVLKDVSLASPFQYQDIAKVLQLNMAFGQSSKMAMALTQAMTDMAAVSPMASPELLERIAYNFSQMSLTGKITARDIRDLALAGVNLNQILVEELGGGMDVVNKKLKEGELTMKDVSQAFIDYAETNFAGAARSMATKTIPGLISSFKDLAVFASKDLFGPAGEVVTKFMEKVYYAAKSLLDSGVLQKVGIWLKVLAETATNFLSKLFGLTESVAEQAASTASTVSTAVSDAVTETLNVATTEAEKTIANFNTIGLDTAIAWLEGFSSADYSVLNSIQGYLSTLSSNLASELGMEGYEAKQLFANLFANITEAISGGDMEGAFDIIIDQFGDAGAKVVELAQANMELAASEEAVTAAQKNLTAANNQLTIAQNKLTAAEKAQDKAMSKIDKTTWEYNEALRKGASPEVLKAKFNQINAAYDEYEASNKAIEAAENEVDVSRAQIDIAQEQVDLAKEQQKVLQEQADTIEDLVDVLMQFAKAQQAAADATTSAIEDIEDEYTQLADITSEDLFEPATSFDTTALENYEKEVEGHFAKINEWIANMPSLGQIFAPPAGYDSWGAWWKEKGIVGGILDLSIGKLFSAPGGYTSWADWWQAEWEGTEDPLGGDKFGKKGLKERISETLVGIKTEWDELWSGDHDWLGALFQPPEGYESWTDFWNKALVPAWDDLSSEWEQNGFWGVVERMFSTTLGNVKSTWDWYWNEYTANAKTAFESVGTMVNTVISGIGTAFANFLNIDLSNLNGGFDTLYDKMITIKDEAFTWFIDKVNDVRQSLFDLRDNLKAIGDWFSYLWGLITGFIQNPLASLQSAWEWLAGLFGYSGGGASGASSGISGSTSGAQGSVIPSAYTTQSTVSTVSNSTGSTVINLTVGDINNGMDLNSLTTLIKQVTGGSLVYG